MPPAPPPKNYNDASRVKEVRDWIAAAQRDGVAEADMILRLTSRDAAALKRSPAVATNEIAFAAGEMRFLGVKVQEAGVKDSLLDRTPG
jgi:hypothetical protein